VETGSNPSDTTIWPVSGFVSVIPVWDWTEIASDCGSGHEVMGAAHQNKQKKHYVDACLPHNCMTVIQHNEMKGIRK